MRPAEGLRVNVVDRQVFDSAALDAAVAVAFEDEVPDPDGNRVAFRRRRERFRFPLRHQEAVAAVVARPVLDGDLSELNQPADGHLGSALAQGRHVAQFADADRHHFAVIGDGQQY